MELPPAFQALALRAQTATVAGAPPIPSTDPTTSTAGKNKPGNSNRKRDGEPGTKKTFTRATNNAPNTALVAFFAALQQAQDIHVHYKRTRHILAAANLTIESALQALNLQPEECFNYQAQGSCSSKLCKKPHVPKSIANAAVTALLNKLNPLLNSLKNKPLPSRSS